MFHYSADFLSMEEAGQAVLAYFPAFQMRKVGSGEGKALIQSHTAKAASADSMRIFSTIQAGGVDLRENEAWLWVSSTPFLVLSLEGTQCPHNSLILRRTYIPGSEPFLPQGHPHLKVTSYFDHLHRLAGATSWLTVTTLGSKWPFCQGPSFAPVWLEGKGPFLGLLK
jgi:hypothetical protein